MSLCHRVLNPVWSFSYSTLTHLSFSATHYINFSRRPGYSRLRLSLLFYFACSNDMQTKWWWWVARIRAYAFHQCVLWYAHRAYIALSDDEFREHEGTNKNVNNAQREHTVWNKMRNRNHEIRTKKHIYSMDKSTREKGMGRNWENTSKMKI